MERKIKYTTYERFGLTERFCAKSSTNKREWHEQTETGNNRQKTITSEQDRSGLSESANASGFRNNTQRPAETCNSPQEARTTGKFARDSAEPRNFMQQHAFLAFLVQKSPVFANVRLCPKTPDFDRVGRKSSILARDRLSPTDIVESGQTSPSKRQQQVSSGKRRKRLGGGIRLFVVQNAGGLAQAGRKGEPAMPVALPRRVFA